MRHEISHCHVAGENKGDHARIGADEKEDAANDFDRALNVDERRHRRASRRSAQNRPSDCTTRSSSPTLTRPGRYPVTLSRVLAARGTTVQGWHAFIDCFRSPLPCARLTLIVRQSYRGDTGKHLLV